MGSSRYRHRFAELAQKHFFGAGALSDSSVSARWDARVNEVRPLIIAESARWGDFRRDPARTTQDWQRAVDFVREQFFPNRNSIVIEQLRQAKRWEFGYPGDPLVSAPLYGGVSTSTAVDVKASETTLEQNYPNPFAGETTLHFTSQKPAHVRLDVSMCWGVALTPLLTSTTAGERTRCGGTLNPCRAACTSCEWRLMAARQVRRRWCGDENTRAPRSRPTLH